jgi:hypothetical protein
MPIVFVFVKLQLSVFVLSRVFARCEPRIFIGGGVDTEAVYI